MTIQDDIKGDVQNGLAPRSYPATMLLPIFPEPECGSEFSTTLDDLDVKITVDGPGDTMVTPVDRRFVSILSAALARQIRSGLSEPKLCLSVPELLRAIGGKRNAGGEEYVRLQERLNRLMATVVETSRPMPGGMRRNHRFRWVSSYKYDSSDTSIGDRTKTVEINLTPEAFAIMTNGLGFDTPPDIYRSVTSNPSSTWRIYEICLAKILENQSQTISISMEELHQRIPLQCPLKVFKSRALRRAFDDISSHPEMSRRMTLKLLRKTEREENHIEFSQRAKSDEVFIEITPGDLSDIKPDRLLDQGGNIIEEMRNVAL